ncbi:GFA family protein [Tabrizicola sp. J26]|uniref:GFA family protein n=1 Tax=Alitabrizicola rongguiensis TaxID=2909234 RepID=UPI001F2F2CEF|nr:GFA family protein [Tabrizicola rongguiensis]MCF1708946.1 GFA family protein [Tabrizicola rongguiensis]
MEGQCTCGHIRYRMTDRPLFVHACHCSWCQRETGSAFALNALIETSRLEVDGAVDYVMTPSASGKGQEIARCPDCLVALWSHYGSLRRKLAFVRVGTLRDPAGCPPDVHIFTSTKLPWVLLPEGVPAFEEYYSTSQLWPATSLARREALKA